MRELVARVKSFFGQRRPSLGRPLPELDPAFVRGKPMTSYFGSLTPEQQKRVLAYDGDHVHGDPNFPREKRRVEGKPAHA